jgi:undecaprenyl phosphate-alpha-L-ara4N flippase subunit ArnE
MIKLVLFAFVIAVGQLMFKRVSMGLGDAHGLQAIGLKLATDPLFILALILYGSATILWVLALREVPLSIAYPFTALAFVLVPVASAFLFGDALGPRYFLGLAMVVGGVWILGSGVKA